jgi:hypothetical protein
MSDLRAAAPLNPAVLELLARDPVAAGCEPGAELLGALIITEWREDDRDRHAVQPTGIFADDRHAALLILAQIVEVLLEGFDRRRPS